MKDKRKTIGVYCVCNTMGICVHEIDCCEDRVLASANGQNPQWCPMNEQTPEGGEDFNVIGLSPEPHTETRGSDGGGLAAPAHRKG